MQVKGKPAMKKIVIAMIEKDLSSDDVGRLAGISPALVDQMISGQINDPEWEGKIAAALGISL
jgi:predicted transcriptional regulator